MLFIHETFLVYKLETFRNCKEVKHIMIMIIAIIYIFFILWDIWSAVEITFRKSSGSPEKIHPLFYSPSPLKIQKVQVPFTFCQHWKFFSPPLPCKKGVLHYVQLISSWCTKCICILNTIFTTHVQKSSSFRRCQYHVVNFWYFLR